jgi:hypothetical protein
VVPRTLAENAGHNATEIISQLYAAHTGGKTNDGVNVEVHLFPFAALTEVRVQLLTSLLLSLCHQTGGTINAAEADILDLLASKASALKLAADAATTILRIDQVTLIPLSVRVLRPRELTVVSSSFANKRTHRSSWLALLAALSPRPWVPATPAKPVKKNENRQKV